MTGKRVIGITASHRKTGNSEIVIKAIADKLEGWDLSLIRLPQLRIKPCKGCYACLLPGVMCNLSDDMQWLLDRIGEADAVIFAVPNYVLGPVGIMKMMADRALQAMPYYENFRRKNTAVALTLGREDYRGYADTALISQVAALGLPVSGLELFYGTHPGEVALDQGFDEKIARLATSLLAGKTGAPPAEGRCPRCFSDLFRIRNGELECALCKSRAKQEGGSLEFHHFHHEFGEDGREEHFKWLLGKKEEYAGLKDALLKVRDNYKRGEWLSPPVEVPSRR
jgi:multimeric flavodoxin WrbA